MAKAKIIILGSGVSGQAAARLAESLEIPCNIVSDTDKESASCDFKDYDQVIVSPGIPPDSPLYQKALVSGKEIISELEFAARHFRGRYVAITGTNGKTTTTELCTHLLLSLKVNAVSAGNIGHPFSSVCADVINGRLAKDTVAVIEVSSFQLERIDRFAPVAAALLNIAEDHLDRYPKGIDDYKAAKENIFKNISPENHIYGITYKNQAKDAIFTFDKNSIKFKSNDLAFCDRLALRGMHNCENIIAALELVSRVVDLNKSHIPLLRKALEDYKPGKHRIEKIATHNQVSYIDDSKGTNPAAVVAALKSIPEGNIRLILGGMDKQMDFSPLNAYSSLISKAYITGECRNKIYETVSAGINCEKFDDFDRCVLTACSDSQEGDTVLLSPGCASWDMFKNYKERGKRFCELVNESANRS